MEKYRPSTGLLFSFLFAMMMGCTIYSCTEVKSYANGLKPLKPELLSLPKQEITIAVDTEKVRPVACKEEKLKRQNEYKEMSKKAEKTFNDVAEIKSYLQNMTNIFLARATDLRKKNDELITMFLEDRKNIQIMLDFLRDERTARIKAEKDSSADREYNKSSREATIFYANIFICLFVSFAISVGVGSVILWRKQQKVEKSINSNHV